MLAFHYVAINPQRQQLSGVIEAADEQTARKKLNDLGVSIISISLVDAPAHDESTKPVFEFEAFDKNGKKIVGTIVGEDALVAYARLFEAYQLNVIYLCVRNASESEKNEARKNGIADLQARYEKIKVKSLDASQPAALGIGINEAERQVLLEKINSTTKRIIDFLTQYNADLKPDERDIIQSYLNQLSRIKDSSNLDHIRSTCERMLEHIQKQELFINEKEKRKVSATLKLQTHNLLDQLKATGLQQEISLASVTKKLEQKPLLEPIARLLNRFFAEPDPAIQSISDQIKGVNHNITTYIRVLFIGPKSIRHEAWESIKVLRGEKKRLMLQREALRQQARKITTAEGTVENGILYDLSGWLLGFYMVGYFSTYLFTIKQIGATKPPHVFFFYSSALTNDIVLGIFILFCIQRSMTFFVSQDQPVVRWGAYAGGLISYLLLSINLL
ncbi:hypothetical protein KBD59_03660 [Candidatus Gracilibacteria bacterium]|nr:hypothetical protein [Candidatus Gracilibacteria bacterium]